MDVRMPGLDGVETAERLLARHPATVVVLLSAWRAEELGAVGVSTGLATLDKQSLSSDALRSVWDLQRQAADAVAGRAPAGPGAR
jgi:CheY-like chemotaxis protein